MIIGVCCLFCFGDYYWFVGIMFFYCVIVFLGIGECFFDVFVFLDWISVYVKYVEMCCERM